MTTKIQKMLIARALNNGFHAHGNVHSISYYMSVRISGRIFTIGSRAVQIIELFPRLPEMQSSQACSCMLEDRLLWTSATTGVTAMLTGFWRFSHKHTSLHH